MSAFEIVERSKLKGPGRFKVSQPCANGCKSTNYRGPKSGRHVVTVFGTPVSGFCDRCIADVKSLLGAMGADLPS